jgi:hypothetical protein
MSDRPLDAELPNIPGRRWSVAVDTFRAPPEDVVPPERQRPYAGALYQVGPHTVVVLEARRP